MSEGRVVEAMTSTEKLDIETVEGQNKAEQVPGAARLESEFVDLKKWQVIWKFRKAVGLCVAAMVAILLDGFALSLPGNIVSNPGFIKQFGTVVSKTGVVSLDSRYVSAWGGIVIAGQWIGQFCGGWISDRFGRVVGRFTFTVILIVGCIAETFSRNWKGWLVAKLIMGFGQGLTQTTTLIYVTEIAPTQVRGSLVALYGVFLGLGQLTASIALQVVILTDKDDWLKAIYSQWVLHGLWLMCIFWLPESPWWHARAHRAEKSQKVLKRLYGGTRDYNAEREYEAMRVEIEHEEERKTEQRTSSYKEIFTHPNLLRTLGGGFAVMSLMLSGTSVTFTYATYFFQQAGLPNPFQATVIAYTLLVVGVLVCVTYLTERFGRRTLLLTGSVGCATSNFIIGALGCGPTTTPYLNATLAVICIWIAFYSTCFAGVGWGISAEISAPRLRGKTTAVCMSFYMVFSIISSFTVPLMLAKTGPGARNWGVKTMFLYAILGTFGSVINYFYVPEIKGRTYNEIDEMYEARVPPRKMRTYRTLVEQEGTKTHR